MVNRNRVTMLPRRASLAVVTSIVALAFAPTAAGAGEIVTGLGSGGPPQVSVFDAGSTAERASFLAYAGGFTGGVRVATGDVNGDGVMDIVTGAGPGGGSHVKVFDGVTGAEVRSFLAFDASFAGGVFVAAGDVSGDGLADVIVGADAPSGPLVKVFDAVTGLEIRSFFAYTPSFTGGVRVAAGDLNGDGFADIVTGAGPGGGTHVKVFDGVTGLELRSFLAFPGFTGGVFVAAGDVNGDGRDDLVVGADETGGPLVKAFDGVTGLEFRSFFAYTPSFTGGVRVAAGDANGDGYADIVTGAGPGGGPHVKVFSGKTEAELSSFLATSPAFAGGVYVAAIAAALDTQPPVLDLPGDLTVDATGPTGRVVTFQATATDAVDGDVSVTCVPPSGSLFPIGDTTVACSAHDFAGNTARGSFVVHVRDAGGQAGDLETLVAGFDVDHGLAALLRNKVREAERAIAAETGACAALDELLLVALGKAAKGELSFDDAQALLAATNRIEQVLGCIPEDSTLPAVQHDLVELMRTIDGLRLAGGEASALLEKARRAGAAAVAGSPCASLGDLAAKIAADTGKPNKLTASQGATLSAAVAAIAGAAGCP